MDKITKEKKEELRSKLETLTVSTTPADFFGELVDENFREIQMIHIANTHIQLGFSKSVMSAAAIFTAISSGDMLMLIEGKKEIYKDIIETLHRVSIDAYKS